MLHDVAGPGAVAQALDEAAAIAQAAVMLVQARQPGQQALVEAGQLVRGEVLQRTDVDQDFDRLVVGPDAGAAQVVGVQDLYGLMLHLGLARKPGCGRQGAWSQPDMKGLMVADLRDRLSFTI